MMPSTSSADKCIAGESNKLASLNEFTSCSPNPSLILPPDRIDTYSHAHNFSSFGKSFAWVTALLVLALIPEEKKRRPTQAKETFPTSMKEKEERFVH
eukprot:1051009-Pelagomonas_calceolata.AAC.1